MIIKKITGALWGDFSAEELKKFLLLSTIITTILYNFWMLRSIKNAVFNDLVGFEFQPYAKIMSIFVVATVVSIYSKLVDMLNTKQLFDVLCLFFAFVFFIVGLGVENTQFFSLSEQSFLYNFFTWIPGNFIGWVSYLSIESFSILIILFWSFVTSTTDVKSAKKGYGMVITFIQMGTIAGSAFVANFVTVLGSNVIILIGSALTLLIPFLVRIYLANVPCDISSKKDKKEKTGFLEGIKLVMTRPYIIGILVISTFYNAISVILEFQMNMIARDVFESRDLLAAFTGRYGVYVNSLALVFSFCGTSFFMRKFGLRACLLIYPAIIGMFLLMLLYINFADVTKVNIMWSLLVTIVAIKGLSYALNNPTKEIMYNPTSKDIRYKSKSWIDSFGQRSAKGVGSSITASFANNVPALLSIGTFISLTILLVWLFFANDVGKKFDKLQKDGKIIE